MTEQQSRSQFMTADDARKMVAEATAVDGEKVRIVLDLWYAAIRKAAADGRDFVGEGDCDRVRTPIPASARMAAIEQLRRDGFVAKHVQVDRDGSTEMTIFWKAKENSK